ncbi:MAG: hypothetical protein QGG25_04770 [Phycisphaerae bacterium]|nr:hypothetical protein [Phycisphaerae bacterium]
MTILVVASVLVLTGCEQSKNSESPAHSGEHAAAGGAESRPGDNKDKSESRTNLFEGPGSSSKAAAEAAQYVRCQAVLLSHNEGYQWCEFDTNGTSYLFIAPLSTFKITKPERFRSREAGIVFKYSDYHQDMLPTLKQSVGKTFLFDLPKDFLTGKAAIIDTSCVPTFKRVTP